MILIKAVIRDDCGSFYVDGIKVLTIRELKHGPAARGNVGLYVCALIGMPAASRRHLARPEYWGNCGLWQGGFYDYFEIWWNVHGKCQTYPSFCGYYY